MSGMPFIEFDLKQRKRGETAVVTLNTAANVRLLDSSNRSSFKAGRQHRYAGGHVTKTPYRIQIPRDGHWWLVVDTAGRSRVKAGVRIEPSLAAMTLPPARSAAAPDLGQIARNVAENRPAPPTNGPDVDMNAQHDVFISHASEDKDAIVRPLATALQDRGVTVWYDEFTMRLGDSLRRKIDHGLATCRFGVVVLSEAFFAKDWPQYELDGLVSRQMGGGGQLILPLWHNLSKDQLLAKSPSLADLIALRTSDLTVAEIADQIADAVLAKEA